jgi:hypothetical protein
MFARVELMLARADAGCQLWVHEIAQASALVVNTLYFLDLDFFQRRATERARHAIITYANSRCIAELHALRHRDEALREAAWAALDDLRVTVQNVRLNDRASSLLRSA